MIESKGRHKSPIRGSSGLRVRPALEERTLGGSGGMPPQKHFGFRPSEIVAGAIWGRNTRPYGRRTCYAMLVTAQVLHPQEDFTMRACAVIYTVFFSRLLHTRRFIEVRKKRGGNCSMLATPLRLSLLTLTLLPEPYYLPTPH